jgi:beta-lactamase class A
MKRWMAGLAAALVLTGPVAGCGDDPSGGAVGVAAEAVPAGSAASPSRPSGPGASPPASAKDGPGQEVARYLGGVPGTVGLVVRDTVTGSSWQAGEPSHAAWTASTIKLAIATDLLERSRGGAITLTGGDRDTMRRMLVNSDNAATDALWEKYDGVGMIAQFQQRFGMATLAVVSGYRPYWRHLQCSAEDLATVMAYALANLPLPDRTQLITWLRAAAGLQQWGVQAAGSDAGHKPGWAFKPEGNPDHWVVHSVGFAGPGERYIVAVTYDLPKGRTAKQGAQVISDVVALAFGKERRPVKGP